MDFETTLLIIGMPIIVSVTSLIYSIIVAIRVRKSSENENTDHRKAVEEEIKRLKNIEISGKSNLSIKTRGNLTRQDIAYEHSN